MYKSLFWPRSSQKTLNLALLVLKNILPLHPSYMCHNCPQRKKPLFYIQAHGSNLEKSYLTENPSLNEIFQHQDFLVTAISTKIFKMIHKLVCRKIKDVLLRHLKVFLNCQTMVSGGPMSRRLKTPPRAGHQS